jgi:DNA-binding protein HU-beta
MEPTVTTKSPRTKSVNKKELTNKLASRAKISKTRAAEYIDTITNIIAEALIDGKKVTISDFGTFNLSQRESFEGYDPKNKIRIQVPRRIIPVFRAGKLLKNSLNIPSIRRCTIKGPKQIEVDFTKLMDASDELILQKSSYNIIYTNGKVSPVTNIEISKENDKGERNGIESVLITLQQNISNVDYVVKIQPPLRDLDGNVSISPLLWSNSKRY